MDNFIRWFSIGSGCIRLDDFVNTRRHLLRLLGNFSGLLVEIGRVFNFDRAGFLNRCFSCRYTGFSDSLLASFFGDGFCYRCRLWFTLIILNLCCLIISGLLVISLRLLIRRGCLLRTWIDRCHRRICAGILTLIGYLARLNISVKRIRRLALVINGIGLCRCNAGWKQSRNSMDRCFMGTQQ